MGGGTGLGLGWTLQHLLARHWQDLGYMILYITGRPDMQKQRVVSWLSQHNFPQGMIFFSDGLVHDPLRQKAIFLRNLVQEVSVRPRGGALAWEGMRPPKTLLHTPPLLLQPSGASSTYPTIFHCTSGCPVCKVHSRGSHWVLLWPCKVGTVLSDG